MRCAWLAALLAAAVLPGPAFADVSLPGDQHLGDGNDPALTPADPVTRAQMQANPMHFYLSQSTTVTAVRLDTPLNLGSQLQVFIDDMFTPLAGTLAGDTYTLALPLSLGSGPHTIWPDGGCNPFGFATPCLVDENDFGFSGVTLISTQLGISRSEHRRRHLGDTPDAVNDGYGGRWYPDAPDAVSVDIVFTLDVGRLLGEIQFWRVRDVGAAPAVAAQVSLDGISIGSLSNGDVIFPMAVALGAGAHTLHVQTGAGDPLDLADPGNDDVSWDDTVLVLVNNPLTTPGAFNAVDTGADGATGQIQTKVAGSAATVDLVALSGGAPLAAYTGTVSVSLLDASNTTGLLLSGTNCDAGWTTIGGSTDVVFGAGDGGRKAHTFTYADALPDARLLMTDYALGVTGCSADNFAIRPASFAGLQASHDDRATPGTTALLATGAITASTLPVHQAGQSFTLAAIAVNGASVATPNYTGSPVIVVAGSALGATVGTATATSWSTSGGQVTSNDARYDEAGAPTILLRDTTFALVDADDTAAVDRTIESAPVTIGRFVPDHFTFTQVAVAQFAASCSAGGFTYVGEPFAFVNTPSARITAVDKFGTTTTNYTGVLAKLAVDPQSSYAVVTTPGGVGVFDAGGMPNPDNSFIAQSPGVWLYTLVLRTGGYDFVRGAPGVPFQADIAVGVVYAEGDGVAFAAASPGSFGVAASGQGIPFTGAAVSNNNFRFGRLTIDNAHGSEKLPLTVPIRAEYWDAGGQGFSRNLLDSCTSLPVNTIGLTPDYPGSTAIAEPNTLVAGVARPLLSAPLVGGLNVPEQVRLLAQIATTLPWLLTDDGDADTDYDDEPKAVASFGKFKNDERRIFQREVIGP